MCQFMTNLTNKTIEVSRTQQAIREHGNMENIWKTYNGTVM